MTLLSLQQTVKAVSAILKSTPMPDLERLGLLKVRTRARARALAPPRAPQAELSTAGRQDVKRSAEPTDQRYVQW